MSYLFGHRSSLSIAGALRRLGLTLAFCLGLAGYAGHALAFNIESAASGSGQALGEFLPVDEALPFSSGLTDNGVELTWNIAPEHYLYRDRIKIVATDADVQVGTPQFSQGGHTKDDPYFGKVTVFTEPVNATVPVTLPDGLDETTLKVTYQGCADAGLCYPPQTRDVLFMASAGGGTVSINTADRTPAPPAANTETAAGIAALLQQQSLLTITGLFLLLGLGLTFTPCVLPMIPIISALVANSRTRTPQALALAISYVLGMALTYAAAGVLTGLLGASFNLQAQLQSPVVLITFATLFTLFALSMFGLFELRLPQALTDRLTATSSRLSGGHLISVFGIGALSALIVSPCVSAPLAGSLLYISTTQDAVLGGLALLALGLGMGIPLIIVAVGGRKLLPSTGAWMNTVKAFYGVLLLAVAIWLMERLLPGWITLILWGLLAAVTGVQLGAFERAEAGWQRTWKGLGLVLFAYAIVLLGGGLAGASDPLRPLAPFTASEPVTFANASHAGASESPFQRTRSTRDLKAALASAAQAGKPVMLDFYADWCISCKVMERNVFSDPQVRAAMAPMTLLQIDVTDNTPEQQALLDELNLFGPPAILFFDPSGEEMTGARVMGEMDRAEFLAHLEKTRKGQAQL